MKCWLLTLSLISSPLIVWAGGSFYLSDIEGLLEQQPQLWNYIRETMEISEVGVASRISSGVNKELAGVRIGPYLLQAKPRGIKGPPIFEIEVLTNTQFYDAKSKGVPLDQAVDYKEVLVCLRIRCFSSPPKP